MSASLRPYQRDCQDAVARALNEGLRRLLVQAATGCGKTQIFASMWQHPQIAEWLDSLPKGRGAKYLIVAHRRELIDQALARVQSLNPGLLCSVEQEDRFANNYSDLIVASVQTLAARKHARLKRLLTRHDFRIVVADECHHAVSPSWRTALVLLGFLPPADASDKNDVEAATHEDAKQMSAALRGWDEIAPKDRLLLGFTATPNRADQIGLSAVFQAIASQYPLRQATDDGWLAPIRAWVIETSESLDEVRTTHGDFNQKDLAEAVNTVRRNRLAFDSWKLHAADRSTLAFTVDIAHAHDLARVFSYNGVNAKAISGDTPREERRQALADYTDGKIQVLTNAAVFLEGVDLPRTACVLMAKPTKSASLFEQAIGRGLRTYPGKDCCVLIDLVDVARRHTLMTPAVLYGLPPGLTLEGKTLSQAADDLDEFREKYPSFDLAKLAGPRFTMEDLLRRAVSLDLWKVPALPPFMADRSLKWTKLGEDEYRVRYPVQDGAETLSVQKNMLGAYDVVLTVRVTGRAGLAVTQRTLAAGVAGPAEAATLAEAFVEAERPTVVKLKDPEAPWRRKAMTDKQLALLHRLGVPFAPGLTAGAASDLIDLGMARKGRY